MGYALDFKALKALASLRQVAEWLFGTEIKNGRAMCPVNEGDKREMVFTYDKELWYCFGCKKGGDQIELIAHTLQCSQKEAAAHLSKKFHGYEPAKKGLPENGLDYLDYTHATVKAIGLTPEKAEELGIGWAGRGTLRNHLLFPLRDKQGKLLGYIGYGDNGFKLPKNLL